MSIETLPDELDDEEVEETIPLSPEEIKELEHRVDDCEDRINRIKHTYPVNGGSSFYDVTGNLLGVSKSNLRILKLTPIKNCYDIVVTNTPCLEAYLNLIESNDNIRTAEITRRDGFNPELRIKADNLKSTDKNFRPIIYYVNELRNTSWKNPELN